MAFHLGCLRVLHERGLLNKIRVVSTVSGGSVIGACLAYWGVDFAEFDRRIIGILRSGLNRSIGRSVFLSGQTPRIFATLVCTAGPALVLGTVGMVLKLIRAATRLPTRCLENRLAHLSGALPIWGSLTTAFEHALRRDVFGDALVDDVRWEGAEVIINACDLRTGTAFRFGSRVAGGWRYGRVVDARFTVAKAVAASAAFPLLLPPLVERFCFEKGGRRSISKVVLTDGGVYDNLGTSVLEPGSQPGISISSFPVTHIISLNAGAGQLGGEASPFWWISRVAQSFETVHRKVQDAAYSRLHEYVRSKELEGFGMVYLGQIDERLPHLPPDLVRRDQVRDYPTNFAPMSAANLELLTRRGEQLTRLILDQYLSAL